MLQPDGIAQVSVVLPGNLLVRMQRIAPGVQRADAQPVRRDLVQPCRPALRVGQQECDIAVRVRGVASDTDFDIGHLGYFTLQPGQHVDELAISERFEHHAYPRRKR